MVFRRILKDEKFLKSLLKYLHECNAHASYEFDANKGINTRNKLHPTFMQVNVSWVKAFLTKLQNKLGFSQKKRLVFKEIAVFSELT